MAIKKNPAGQEETIDIVLNEKDHPIAFKAKVKELVESGLTEQEAKNFVSTTPIQLEFYYSPNQGLFLVESEAVEAVLPMYDPYTGEQMEEIED